MEKGTLTRERIPCEKDDRKSDPVEKKQIETKIPPNLPKMSGNPFIQRGCEWGGVGKRPPQRPPQRATQPHP
jgi:hypothetical protein